MAPPKTWGTECEVSNVHSYFKPQLSFLFLHVHHVFKVVPKLKIGFALQISFSHIPFWATSVMSKPCNAIFISLPLVLASAMEVYVADHLYSRPQKSWKHYLYVFGWLPFHVDRPRHTPQPPCCNQEHFKMLSKQVNESTNLLRSHWVRYYDQLEWILAHCD